MTVDRKWFGEFVKKDFLQILANMPKIGEDGKTVTQQTGMVESIMIECMTYGHLLT
jgi:hypothetical protein